jgi:hypothetical protein
MEIAKERIITSAKSKGVKVKPFVSCRVTQTYDTGACIYFYFGIVWDGLKVDHNDHYLNESHYCQIVM